MEKQIKNIQYKGYTTRPDDYMCEDGDLQTAINILPEDGTLKPVSKPKTMFTLADREKLMFVHKSNTFVDVPHYITLTDEEVLSWCKKDGTDKTIIDTILGENIKQITSVGNTLMILTDNGIRYYLWKGSGYKYLGNHLPELPISFGLQGTMERKDVTYTNGVANVDVDDVNGAVNTLDASYYPNQANNGREYPNQATINFISNQIIGTVNKFIKEQSVDKGKFLYPFFVRYAFRLYDGSLTMHSSPVLMNACSNVQPMVIAKDAHYDSGITDFPNTYVYGEFMDLDYNVVEQKYINEITTNWTDIISSVDVFISKPIYTYDQNGQVKSHSLDKPEDMGVCVCKDTVIGGNYDIQSFGTLLKKAAYIQTKFNEMDAKGITYDGANFLHFNLPARSSDAVADDIRNISQFYFLTTIRTSELTTTTTKINVPADFLQSLVNREVMTDDYLSHDKVIPGKAFPYNGRLNLTDITVERFSGFRPDTMLERKTTATITTSANVVLDTIDGEKIVVSEMATIPSKQLNGMYVFYPNTQAKKITIGSKIINLEKSNFLNGSFGYIRDFSPITLISSSDVKSTFQEKLLNKIYTSEVNNPFFFPVLGINTIGTGSIMGICAAVEALSQGQFGQFPMYAFSDEGVWALEVSDTGTYRAKQPVTRDVCINPDSITQIDNAVIFATDRGIMALQGANTTCLTDGIDDKHAVSSSSLPKINELELITEISTNIFNTIPFLEYIKTCRMLYNYTLQYIMVYNPTLGTDGTLLYKYSYIYSLKSKLWSMAQANVTYNINSYPDTIATIYKDVVDLTQTGTGNYKSLIITRPLKLDMPDYLKTVDQVIQRGVFKDGHVQFVLYGSRDMYNWLPIASTTNHFLRCFAGTPYKYFRLAIICNLDVGETLTGCSIRYWPRMVDQLR